MLTLNKKQSRFTSTEIREELTLVDIKTVRRHLELLLDKQMIVRVGGTHNTGYEYEVNPKIETNSEQELWNNLIELITKLK